MIPQEWQLRVPEGIDDPSTRAFVQLVEERLGGVPVERVLVWYTDTVVESALAHLAQLFDVDLVAHGPAQTRVLLTEAIDRLRRRGTASAPEETVGALAVTAALVVEDTVIRYDGTIKHDGKFVYGHDGHWAIFWLFVESAVTVDWQAIIRAVNKTKRRSAHLGAIYRVTDIEDKFDTIEQWYRNGEVLPITGSLNQVIAGPGNNVIAGPGNNVVANL